MKNQSFVRRGPTSIKQHPCHLGETGQRPAAAQGPSIAPVHLWREDPRCRPDEALLEAMMLKVCRFANGVRVAV